VIYLFFDRLAMRFSRRHREMRSGTPQPSPAQ
jgi:hypothetical protein